MHIRKLSKIDVPRMVEWMHNKNITENFRFNGDDSNIDTVTTFIINSLTDRHNMHFAVTDDNDIYMGTVSLKNIDYQNENAEYAIAMHMDALGKGYAKFATDKILEIAFTNLKLNRVYLNVLSKNKRAIRFYEKYGFIYEGEFMEHILHNGKLESLRWYRILSSENKTKNRC